MGRWVASQLETELINRSVSLLTGSDTIARGMSAARITPNERGVVLVVAGMRSLEPLRLDQLV